MAAASLHGLCQEALCTVCLEYFKDPVITECGHNFCRACLARCWEWVGGEEVSCPQCRGIVRRNLIPNRQLANFVELTRKLQLQGERGGICGRHQEPIKFFCKEDEAPICLVCDKSKEHGGHQVVPLEEAAQDYKDLICHRLEFLKTKRNKILAYIAETERKSQGLLKETKAEMEKAKKQFRELQLFLNEQEKLLMAQIEEMETQIKRKRAAHLARLSEELFSLEGLIQEMEQKHHQPPEELLQDVRSTLQRCEEEEEKILQNPAVFPPGVDLKLQDVSDRNTFLAEKMRQFRDILVSGCWTVAKVEVEYEQCQFQKANVTLDPNTAHPQLILSENLKSLRSGPRRQVFPNNPERFIWSRYALGCEGFTAGRHYWEVTVNSKDKWAVGVARKSVWRIHNTDLRIEEGIWAIGRWNIAFRASDRSPESVLSLSSNLRKIRVSLNYSGGQVAFHDADTGSHLYTFSGASFSGETLLPFFCVEGKGSLTISF